METRVVSTPHPGAGISESQTKGHHNHPAGRGIAKQSSNTGDQAKDQSCGPDTSCQDKSCPTTFKGGKVSGLAGVDPNRVKGKPSRDIPSDKGAKLLVYSGRICGHVATFMLDSGAECNVITKSFVDKVGLKTSPVTSPIIAKGYDGVESDCKDQILRARLRLKELKDEVNLLVLNVSTCDVILGKSWLAKHNP